MIASRNIPDEQGCGRRGLTQFFPNSWIPSVEVVGAGKNTKSLVEEAIRLKQRTEVRDHYWCVFDRDSFPAGNFNAALQMATNAGFRVAYSNEAFEIWYLLHFEYFVSGIARNLYKEKLTVRLGRPYEKNDPRIFESLEGRQAQAIRYAEKLIASYPNHNPEKDNPCTAVHLLVQQLRDLKVALSSQAS